MVTEYAYSVTKCQSVSGEFFCEVSEQGRQSFVARTFSCRSPLEPCNLLALVDWWGRVAIATGDEVPEIEMSVTSPAGVDVEVDERGHAIGIEGDELNVEAGLFARFPAGTVPGSLTRIDVTAGLQPEPEPLVPQQHDTSRPDHDRGARHVDRIERLVERVVELVEVTQEASDSFLLDVVDRHSFDDGPSHAVTHRRRHSPTVTRGKSNKALESADPFTDT